jgi:hypothetical protein
MTPSTTKYIRAVKYDKDVRDLLIARANVLGLDTKLGRQIKSSLETLLEMKRTRGDFMEKYGRSLNSVGEYGRFYPKHGGMAYVHRPARGALLQNYYHDLDCVNSIPVVAIQYARNHYKRDLKVLRYYVENRDVVHTTLITELGLVDSPPKDGIVETARDQAKKLVNAVMNGKGIKDIKSPWLRSLKSEIYAFAQLVAKDAEHAELYKSTLENGKSVQSFLSKILQREEANILIAMDEALTENGRVPSSWIYDGLSVEKADPSEATLPADLIDAVIVAVRAKTGYEISLKVKPYEAYEWLADELQKWRAMSPMERAIGEMTITGALSPVREVVVSHPYVEGCLADSAVSDAITSMNVAVAHAGAVATGKTTLIIKSHLGTGKTTEAVKMIRQHARVLVLSARKSFTRFIMGDLADLASEGIVFHSYDEAGTHVGSLSSRDYLVCQVESLHRLEEDFADYDLVVVDESETILNQFHSFTTHKENILRNFRMFERIVRGAQRVLFADAFVTQRTLIACANLRDASTSLYINNNYNPYVRKATMLWKQAKTTDARMPAVVEFGKRIMADLEAGKRVAVVWTSLTAAKTFIKNFVEKTTYKYRLYSSESSKKESAELTDVETHWRDLDLLCYTTAITIGVNYNPEEEEAWFDRVYLYACSRTALPRDIAQALLRCRKIRSNELIYTCDISPPPRRPYQIDTIREDFLTRRATLKATNPIISWNESPKWVEDNYCLNERESALRSYVYVEELHDYLTQSGYTLEEEEIADTETTKLEGLDKIQPDEVPIIDYSTAEHIRHRMIEGDASPLDRAMLIRYNLYRQLTSEAKEGEDTPADAIWAEVFTDTDKSATFWNLVNEKHNTPEEYASREASSKFVEMTNQRLLRRTTLAKVLPLLGMTVTAEGKETFEITADHVTAFASLEQEIYKHFTAKGHARRTKEFGASHVADMIEVVFNAWGVETERVVARRRANGKQHNVFSISVKAHPWWACISSKDTSNTLCIIEEETA